jgi:hypothetical protein
MFKIEQAVEMLSCVQPRQAKDVSRSNYILILVILMSYHKSGQMSSKALEPA